MFIPATRCLRKSVASILEMMYTEDVLSLNSMRSGETNLLG